MRPILLLLAALLVLPSGLRAHERLTVGPNGGRLLPMDSPATPNVEFRVTADRRFEIGLFDKDRKPLQPGERQLAVTAGDRGSAKKLDVEAKGETFLTSPGPDKGSYWVILQLREPGAEKARVARVYYNPTVCGDCEKPEWICVCGLAGSGRNVAVPAALDGLWAEINQHTKELHDGAAGKAYEAVDEVTEAFPVLAKALPEKTEAAKKAEAARLVETLLAQLNGIRDAFAARKPADARPHLVSVDETLAKLKALYPAGIANAKLKE